MAGSKEPTIIGKITPKKQEIVTVEQLKEMDVRVLVRNFLDRNNIGQDSELRHDINNIMFDVVTINSGTDNDWRLLAMSMDINAPKRGKILGEITALFQEACCQDSQNPNYNSKVYATLEKLVELIVQPHKELKDYHKIAKICDINLGVQLTTFPISNRYTALHNRLHQAGKEEGGMSR